MDDRWILVDSELLEPGGLVVLPPDEAHHLGKVLRRSAGEGVTLFDGEGRVATGVLRVVERGRVEVELGNVRELPRPDPAAVPAVALGVLHGPAMDWAVQKAVELGVPRFLPVVCRRSQPGRNAAAGRVEHWRRVARQALKQCHRAWAMEVTPPLSLDELLREVPAGRGVVADREGGTPAAPGLEGPSVLLVGPEGGLSADERRAVLAAGWAGLCLGEHVLRAETAVVAGTVLLSRCS